METDLIDLDDKDNCIGDRSIENLSSQGSPDVNNIFGEPFLKPRVGDKYQVDIPSLITESSRNELLANPFDSQTSNNSHAFLVGLPIPIMWVHDGDISTDNVGAGPLRKSNDTADATRSSEARNGKKGQTLSGKKSSEFSVEEQKSKSENSEPVLAVEMNLKQSNGSKSYYAVPGVPADPWSDAEVDSFLLGLYIFGKNFLQIRRFMENKDMRAVLSFYYGKFYRSEAYRRWSGSRKVRRKKCVTGRKLFTGWRQQEFLSRLSTHVSEEPQKLLLEGYKSFAEGRTSFEEYVSSLKSIVGIPILVEVVGIGKGKEDLTSIAMDPGRSNHDILVCPHLPSGQACSSLTSKEIMNLLTGGFRLSKGRCSDIFWEAVWPRLLAKGWHSEQPKNQGYISSKNYLVFLTPGIKKFSRRKLAKGEHYFDSVSDVLNKVASEPKLIELESEESSAVGRNQQDAWSPETGSDQDDVPGSQRHCYLKPRISTSSSSQMKFTVVDTSLVYGGKSSSIRELRHLPTEFQLPSKMTNYLIDDEGDSSGDNLDEFETVEKPLQREKVKHQKGTSDSRGPNCIKFTVVDTSLVHGGKPSKVRELRCSPMVAKDASELTGLLRKNATYEDSLARHEKDASDGPPKVKRKISKSNSNKDMSVGASKSQISVKNSSEAVHKRETQQDQSTCVSGEKHLMKTVLHQFKRRAKPGHSDYVVPVVKRRRLTACAKAKTSEFPQNCSQATSKQVQRQEMMNLPETGMKAVSEVGPKLESSATMAEKSLDEEIKLKIPRQHCSATNKSEGRNEELQAEASSDPDPPQDPIYSGESRISIEATSICERVITDGQCSPSKEKELISETSASTTDVSTFEQSPVANRRQSTRNRPLTTRALEALASGFLNIQRRPKNSGAVAGENPFSNPCRKARSSKAKAATSHVDAVIAIAAPKEDKQTNGGACGVKNSMISKPLDQIEEKRPADQ